MGKQQGIKHIPTNSLQGKGSFIEVRPLTIGESKLQTQQRESKEDEFEAQGGAESKEFMDWANDVGTKILQERVIAWNWGDANGDPLPLPKDDSTVLDRLLADEVDFLAKAVYGLPNPK